MSKAQNMSIVNNRSAIVVSLLFLFGTFQSVFATDDPSTCPNIYGSSVTTLEIDSDGTTFEPMMIPAITAQVGVGYNMTFTLHTDPQSISGNTAYGTTWYKSTAYGRYDSHCVGNAIPNKNITIIIKNIMCQRCADDEVQQVELGGAPIGNQTTYFVFWHKDPLDSIPKPSELSAMLHMIK